MNADHLNSSSALIRRLSLSPTRLSPVDDYSTREDGFHVFFVSAGTMSLRWPHGKLVSLQRGELLIAPSSDPITATATDEINACMLLLPSWAAQSHHTTLLQATRTRWSTNTGTASIVAHVLHAWAAQCGSYSPQQPARLTTHVAGLLSMMFTEQQRRPVSLLDLAKEHIEQNLSDLELAPESIAQAINVSPRTLHRLFTAEQVSVGNWIRHRRLEACRLDLIDPRCAADSISNIGSRWGIPDASHLSRSFKARFGESPRELRARIERESSPTLLTAIA